MVRVHFLRELTLQKRFLFSLDSQLRMFSCFNLEMHGGNFGDCCLQLIVTRYIKNIIDNILVIKKVES